LAIDPTPTPGGSIQSSQGATLAEVSVVIPAYNASPFLGEAILSALEQTRPPLEVIVVDDGSSDGSASLVATRFPQVELLVQPHRGVSAARNRGWRAARAPLVAFLDADDCYLPSKLETQSTLLQSNPRIGVIHSGWQLADEQGRVTGLVEPWLTAPALDLESWLLWKPVFLGAMLFRRRWLEQAGGFAEDLPQAEDVDLMLRLTQIGCHAAWLKQPTAVYRQHAQSTTRRSAEQVSSLSAVLDRFFTQPSLPGRTRRLERKVRYYTAVWSAWHAFQMGDPVETRHCLAESLSYSRRPVDHTVVEWQGEFTRRMPRGESRSRAVIGLRPIFREAAQLEGGAWQSTESLLEWSLGVWQPLLDGDLAESLRALRESGPTTGRSLAKLAQTAMLGVNTPPDSSAVDNWWKAALRQGLLPRNGRHEVTTLHLTLFSQAVLRRQFRRAAASLGYALRAGWMPAALPAWGRFLWAAARYAFDVMRGSRAASTSMARGPWDPASR
jgi:GT2 family glycosyltransferase